MQIADQGKPKIFSRQNGCHARQQPHNQKPHFSHNTMFFLYETYSSTKITDFNRNILFSGKNYNTLLLGHPLCAVNQRHNRNSINFSAYENTLLFQAKGLDIIVVSHASQPQSTFRTTSFQQGHRTSDGFRRSSFDRRFRNDQR